MHRNFLSFVIRRAGSISSIMKKRECLLAETTEEKITAQMIHSLNIMRESVASPIQSPKKSIGRADRRRSSACSYTQPKRFFHLRSGTFKGYCLFYGSSGNKYDDGNDRCRAYCRFIWSSPWPSSGASGRV